MILPPEFFSNPWDRYKDQEDFHSPVTISLGELIRDGVVVWGEPEWISASAAPVNTLWNTPSPALSASSAPPTPS